METVCHDRDLVHFSATASTDCKSNLKKAKAGCLHIVISIHLLLSMPGNISS